MVGSGVFDGVGENTTVWVYVKAITGVSAGFSACVVSVGVTVSWGGFSASSVCVRKGWLSGSSAEASN